MVLVCRGWDGGGVTPPLNPQGAKKAGEKERATNVSQHLKTV